MFCGTDKELWGKSYFAKNCSICQVCGGDCEMIGETCVKKGRSHLIVYSTFHRFLISQ